MTTKFTNTAAAIVSAFAASLFLTVDRAAAQDDIHASIAPVVDLEQVQKMIDDSQKRTLEIAVFKAEQLIELRLQKIENDWNFATNEDQNPAEFPAF